MKIDAKVRQANPARNHQTRSAARSAPPNYRLPTPALAFLSTCPIDAISAHGLVNPFSRVGLYCGDPLENRGVDGERRFLDPFFPSVDRFGTREKKHYSDWFLGVQPPRQSIGVKLLSLLPTRFGRSDHDLNATPTLCEKPLPEMAGGPDREKG
jgi:hypothetical protein